MATAGGEVRDGARSRSGRVSPAAGFGTPRSDGSQLRPAPRLGGPSVSPRLVASSQIRSPLGTRQADPLYQEQSQGVLRECVAPKQDFSATPPREIGASGQELAVGLLRDVGAHKHELSALKATCETVQEECRKRCDLLTSMLADSAERHTSALEAALGRLDGMQRSLAACEERCQQSQPQCPAAVGSLGSTGLHMLEGRLEQALVRFDRLEQTLGDVTDRFALDIRNLKAAQGQHLEVHVSPLRQRLTGVEEALHSCVNAASRHADDLVSCQATVSRLSSRVVECEEKQRHHHEVSPFQISASSSTPARRDGPPCSPQSPIASFIQRSACPSASRPGINADSLFVDELRQRLERLEAEVHCSDGPTLDVRFHQIQEELAAMKALTSRAGSEHASFVSEGDVTAMVDKYQQTVKERLDYLEQLLLGSAEVTSAELAQLKDADLRLAGNLDSLEVVRTTQSNSLSQEMERLKASMFKNTNDIDALRAACNRDNVTPRLGRLDEFVDKLQNEQARLAQGHESAMQSLDLLRSEMGRMLERHTEALQCVDLARSDRAEAAEALRGFQASFHSQRHLAEDSDALGGAAPDATGVAAATDVSRRLATEASPISPISHGAEGSLDQSGVHSGESVALRAVQAAQGEMIGRVELRLDRLETSLKEAIDGRGKDLSNLRAAHSTLAERTQRDQDGLDRLRQRLDRLEGLHETSNDSQTRDYDDIRNLTLESERKSRKAHETFVQDQLGLERTAREKQHVFVQDALKREREERERFVSHQLEAFAQEKAAWDCRHKSFHDMILSERVANDMHRNRIDKILQEERGEHERQRALSAQRLSNLERGAVVETDRPEQAQARVQNGGQPDFTGGPLALKDAKSQQSFTFTTAQINTLSAQTPSTYNIIDPKVQSTSELRTQSPMQLLPAPPMQTPASGRTMTSRSSQSSLQAPVARTGASASVPIPPPAGLGAAFQASAAAQAGVSVSALSAQTPLAGVSVSAPSVQTQLAGVGTASQISGGVSGASAPTPPLAGLGAVAAPSAALQNLSAPRPVAAAGGGNLLPDVKVASALAPECGADVPSALVQMPLQGRSVQAIRSTSPTPDGTMSLAAALTPSTVAAWTASAYPSMTSQASASTLGSTTTTVRSFSTPSYMVAGLPTY